MQKVLTLALVMLGIFAPSPTVAEPPPDAVQDVLESYLAALPAPEDLTIYRLDWTSTFNEAKRKAAREQRPILLAVVTNSFGDLQSGHC